MDDKEYEIERKKLELKEKELAYKEKHDLSPKILKGSKTIVNNSKSLLEKIKFWSLANKKIVGGIVGLLIILFIASNIANIMLPNNGSIANNPLVIGDNNLHIETTPPKC